MPIHTLHTKQTIRATKEEAWRFFSNPRNLAKITPPELGFRIVTPELPERIYAGLMIEYRVTPMLGIPQAWLTEITHVRGGEHFVDEQRIGPYTIWHHEHWFNTLGNGRIELVDRVTYALPFQPFGDLVHPFLVKPQLGRIFAHREKAVRKLFPE
jgi:ligand-binding SRPBCC domain-containing protein